MSRNRKAEVIDPVNLCSHCPHTVLDIGRNVMFCPCEDCHYGGLIQGREPKDNHTVAVSPSWVTNRSNCPLCEAGDPGRHPDHGGTHLGPTPEPEPVDNDEVWIDPVHRVG